jgi:cellulose biosynthesis protein BcsQ
MKTISLFNHKGGVGKTTLTINIADALVRAGKRVLIVDTDPQCNISSFFLNEKDLDLMLGESHEGADSAQTVWSALRPVAEGRGDVGDIDTVEPIEGLYLAVGDVLLSKYEEELPLAWNESFARKTRGYDVVCALPKLARALGRKYAVDFIMYDCGPNIGPLNRTILLDTDFLISPVHTDLFSLRALQTVGQSLNHWISDWALIRGLAPPGEKSRLMRGKPRFIGYISSAFKVYGGHRAMPHEHWESLIAPRVTTRIVKPLKEVGEEYVTSAPFKLGDIPNYAGLPALAQEYGLPLSRLGPHVAGGNQADAVKRATVQFDIVAKNVLEKVRLHG